MNIVVYLCKSQCVQLNVCFTLWFILRKEDFCECCVSPAGRHRNCSKGEERHRILYLVVALFLNVPAR